MKEVIRVGSFLRVFHDDDGDGGYLVVTKEIEEGEDKEERYLIQQLFP